MDAELYKLIEWSRRWALEAVSKRMRHDCVEAGRPGQIVIRRVRGELAPEPMPVFTPVQITADPPLALLAPSSSTAASASVPSVDSRIEITLPDGTCVRVSADVGLATLRRVMVAVRRCMVAVRR